MTRHVVDDRRIVAGQCDNGSHQTSPATAPTAPGTWPTSKESTLGTIHEDAARSLADELMQTDDGREALAFTNSWMRDPENKIKLDIFGQPHGGWAVEQVAALYRILSLVSEDAIRMTYIPVGTAPYSDRARKENRAALAGLPYGITAEVYDGLSHVGDGCVQIPDGLVVVDDSDRDLSGRVEKAPPKLGYVPLEIGYTLASRTLLHLLDHGAVARWPYGFDRIYLVSTVPVTLMRDRWVARLSRRVGVDGGADAA